MSYLVLARKHRPQAFDQVIEQDHITRTLSNAISADRVAHAILFSGPRGTGKTTVARILAKAMNCKNGPTPIPCNACRSCTEITSGNAVDVFEIDGASNNGVDQVRELRENIKYMPAHSLHKIYIIDEVHMLSTPAFNALLKTLEEPPSHVMFIFATTEPQKIPITILSRCQRHDFRRIHLDSISKHLGSLCRQENFNISTESLELIAREAGGSLRDAISLLDQVLSCSEGSISHQQLIETLGIIDRQSIFSLADSILRNDVTAVLDTLDDIYDRGHDIKKLYGDLLEHFRNLLIVKMGKKVDKLVDLPDHEVKRMIEQCGQVSAAELNQVFDLFFREEASVRFAGQPKLALEMVFFRVLQLSPTLPIDDLIDKLDSLRQKIENSPEPKDISQPQLINEPVATSAGDRQGQLDETWHKISELVSRQNPSLAANLAKCSLKGVSDSRLEIEAAGNGFTISMIGRHKNLAYLKRVCAEYFGKEKQIVLKTKLDPDAEKQKKKSQNNLLKQKAISHPLVADAIEIFNGKLVDVKLP